MLYFEQVDVTGSRLIGAITEIGHVGPKHHAVIIGRHPANNNIYAAENCHDGYKLVTVDEFAQRYSSKAKIQIKPNDGKFTDYEVASRALSEIVTGGKGKYNLVTNNCESFSNRAMYNNSESQQVINTVVGAVIIIGMFYYIKKAK